MWDQIHKRNTKGGIGRNIPCDLHNEHVNKLLKEVIANMGSNLMEAALQRAARSIGAIQAICQHFDQGSGVPSVQVHILHDQMYKMWERWYQSF